MKPETVTEVQRSFRALLPHADELAEAVFLRLAKAEPRLSPLFPAGSAPHRRRFAAGLAFAVETLDDAAQMSHGLSALGSACRGLGIGQREIATIRGAVLETVGQALGGAARGSRWTPELRAAWVEAADALVAALQVGPGGETRQAAA